MGLVGIFVPLLPTTPFLLLALFFYSRSSQRLHDWLLNHPRAGGALRAWNEHGVIRPRAKVLALLALWGSIAASVTWSRIPAAGAAALVLLAVALSAFLLSRPSRPHGGD